MAHRHQHLLVAAALLLAACQLGSATTGTDKHRSLVLLPDEAARQTHSKYLGTLELLGGELDVRLSKDKKLQLRHWDDWLYETVIILDPAVTDFGGAVDAALLLEFVDRGGNLLVALDSGASDQIRDLATELGVDVEPAGTSVIDHFQYAAADASHSTVLASGFVDSKAVFGGRTPGPVVFKGLGLSVPPDSVLTFPALWASQTAYSATPKSLLREHANLAGEQVRLAALSQPRSGGRVAVLGSAAMLGDAAFHATVPSGSGSAKAGNEDFAGAVTRWLLHQRGVLKFGDFVHHAPGAESQPDAYRIKDAAEFSVQIQELVDGDWQPYSRTPASSEYSVQIQELVDGDWQPYRADDVQMEFVMLDPYIRTNLVHDNQGIFSAKFQVPDVYGVFKFVIEYRRAGYNHVERSKQIAVRPFKHDEFDRFLVPAYPYYTTALTTMLGFAVLTLVFLYS